MNRLYSILAVSLAAAPLFADSVFVGTLERKDVKVIAFRNGVVEFTISGRSVAPVEAARITRLALDDEPVFTRAEQAFADGDYAQAADGYRKALATTKKPWLADWVAPRLLQAANRAGRFEDAISAFTKLLLTDANAAVAHRPEVPANAPAASLGAAAAELSRLGNSPNLTAAQQLAVTGLLLDVQLAQGNREAADQTAKRLATNLPREINDPSMRRSAARARLGMARLALSKADHGAAMGQLRENAALFTEPAEQAEALFLLAQAHDAAAGQSPSTDVLKDVAIAYMRSVAAAREANDRRFVAPALFRVAEIEQKLGDTKAAASLYGEVAAEYKDSPLAARAAEQYETLSKQTGP